MADMFTHGVPAHQEVLRLQVSVDDVHGVAVVHHADYGAHHLCCMALAKVPLISNAIKQLSSLTQLHNQVDVALVLVRALELHDVWVTREVQQDLHLAPHILNIVRGDQLALRYRLASVRLAGGFVVHKVNDAEIALS